MSTSAPLHILFLYPTRGRRQRFLDGLQSIYDNIADRENFTVQVVCDTDDPEMAGFADHGNVRFDYGVSLSKVDACNRKPMVEFDVLILMQDDLRFTLYGFDEIIREEFADKLDMLLHLPDQDAGSDLATIYIAGRVYYERFNYVYHPSYSSLFCDQEVHDVSAALGCYKYSNIRMFDHMNSAYGWLPKDAMFEAQQEIGWTLDQENYNQRKAINFGL